MSRKYDCHNRTTDFTKEGREMMIPDGYRVVRVEGNKDRFECTPVRKRHKVPPSVATCGHMGRKNDPQCEGCSWALGKSIVDTPDTPV